MGYCASSAGKRPVICSSKTTEPWRRLLESVGLASAVTTLAVKPLTGGRNNRVFAVEGATRPLVIKEYFRDGRNRLGAEWAFVTYAWESGIRVVAEPLAADPDASLAVYERLPGKRLRAAGLGPEYVVQAADFAAALQERSNQASLPQGAEACFTIREHMELIDDRVRKVGSVTDAPLGEFIARELKPTWKLVRAHIHRRARFLDKRANACVSPSDFGFHNALIDEHGIVRFHDFEYAGWDDPAKLLCDFFCQPEVPVPLEHFETMATGPFEAAGERAQLLLDAYRVKWCCIMLNEFLPAGANRRDYAAGSGGRDEQAVEQLAKARTTLTLVEC